MVRALQGCVQRLWKSTWAPSSLVESIFCVLLGNHVQRVRYSIASVGGHLIISLSYLIKSYPKIYVYVYWALCEGVVRSFK